MDSVLHLHSGHDSPLIARVADGDFKANIVVYWYIYMFTKWKCSVLHGVNTFTIATVTMAARYKLAKTGHR